MSKRGYVATLVLLSIGAMSVFLGNLLTIVAREWSFWLMICGGLTFVVTSGALIVLSMVRPTWKKIGLAGCVLGLGLLAMLFSVGVSGLAGARLNLRVNRNAMEEVVRRSWASMERADSAVRLDSGAPLDTRLEVTDGYVAFVQGGMLDHLYGTIYFRDQPLPYGSSFLGRSIGQWRGSKDRGTTSSPIEVAAGNARTAHNLQWELAWRCAPSSRRKGPMGPQVVPQELGLRGGNSADVRGSRVKGRQSSA